MQEVRIPRPVGENMAVGAFYDIMPESPEVDIEKLKADIEKAMPEGVKIADIKVEPVAFGLKKIILSTVMDDAEGLINSLEDSLMRIEGLQSAECVTTTLL